MIEKLALFCTKISGIMIFVDKAMDSDATIIEELELDPQETIATCYENIKLAGNKCEVSE